MVQDNSFSGKPSNLNERQWRIFLAFHAKSIGKGGVRITSNLYKVSEKTIRKGIREVEESAQRRIQASNNIRGKGGGRKSFLMTYPALEEILKEIITKKQPHSLMQLSGYLADGYGIMVSPSSLSNILRKLHLQKMYSENKHTNQKLKQRKTLKKDQNTAKEKQKRLLQTLKEENHTELEDWEWTMKQVAENMGISQDLRILSNSQTPSDRKLYNKIVWKSIQALQLSIVEQIENSFTGVVFPEYKEILLRFFHV